MFATFVGNGAIQLYFKSLYAPFTTKVGKTPQQRISTASLRKSNTLYFFYNRFSEEWSTISVEIIGNMRYFCCKLYSHMIFCIYC